jgi:periplasmic protein TonB
MVLSRAPFWPQSRPQPIRITGLSVAILVNLLLVLLLSLPRDTVFELAAPAASDSPPIFAQIIRDRAQPLPEVPPLPTPPERVVHSRIDPPLLPTPAPVVEHAAFAMPAPDPVAGFEPFAGDGPGVAVASMPAQVAYRYAPPPPYPGPALRAGIEGTVVLRVLIGVNGRAQRVEIEEASGHRQLDRAAQEQVQQRWRFEPAMRNGRAVETWVLIPVDFRMPTPGVTYRFAPPPRYPGPALRAGVEGTVVLQVLVGVDGRPQQVKIDEGSGHRHLDRAAQEQVQQRWQFDPAMRNGRAIDAWVLVPVDFRIPRRTPGPSHGAMI